MEFVWNSAYFVNVGRNAANGLEEQNEAQEDGIDEHHFGRGFEEAATTWKQIKLTFRNWIIDKDFCYTQKRNENG